MSSDDYVSYFRPDIDAMSGYVPGEQPKFKDILKLNTNESPFPPSPGVSETLKNFDFKRLHLYPDPNADTVRKRIAEMYGMQMENVIAGNGSDDLLNIIIRCFTDAERSVAYMWPSYSLYPTLAKLQGAKEIRIPLKEDFSLPENLLEQTKDANLLIITRPNAPTGNSFSREVMAKLCTEFKGIVLIDEAYADFALDNCCDFASRFSNVIVCRTFSKSRCLAGLRFGYALAHKTIIDGLMKMKDSYNVSMLAQELALASLNDEAYFEDCIAKIRSARKMLAEGLCKLGFRIIPSETNFIFAMPPDGDGERFFRLLKEQRIFVRYFAGPVTGKWVRITIGDTKAVERLLQAAGEICRLYNQNNHI